MDPLAPKIHAEYYAITDIGRVRKGNEDNYLVGDLQNERRGLQLQQARWRLGGRGIVFAVCDGMGGAAAGEVASQMAVDIVYKSLLGLEPGIEPQNFGELIDRAILKANFQIHTLADRDESKKGMGTTISAAVVYGSNLFLAQVGDSRAYLLRGGQLSRVTKDQSLLEKLIEEGAISPEHAENFIGKNVILQALGPVKDVLVDLKFVELEVGDKLLLCSDGLHGQLPDKELHEILSQAPSLEEAGKTLIRRANETGGPDNITAIVVEFTGEDLPSPKMPQPANPQPLQYARAPIDTITARLEKELGLTHWMNKYLFAKPLLILYAWLIFGFLGYWIFSNRVTLAKLFTSRSRIQAPAASGSRLVVTSDILNARLFIDDTAVGRLQEGGLSLQLPVGQYRIHLQADEWTSKTHKVFLKAKKTALVEIPRYRASGKSSKDLSVEWLPGRDGL